MKTKVIAISGLVLIGIGVGFFLSQSLRRKKEKMSESSTNKETYIPKTPEALLQRLMERILEENQWKNERDFLSILTKNYLKEVKDISWIDHLPINQEGMMETLGKIGLMEEYEKSLEEKYRRG